MGITPKWLRTILILYPPPVFGKLIRSGTLFLADNQFDHHTGISRHELLSLPRRVRIAVFGFSMPFPKTVYHGRTNIQIPDSLSHHLRHAPGTVLP
jgi:hypothetical protein